MNLQIIKSIRQFFHVKLALPLILFYVVFAPGVSLAQTPTWSVASTLDRVEGSYMPSSIVLQLPQAAGTCPTGQWLSYQPGNWVDATNRKDNMKAVYAMLLTAFATGKKVSLVGFKKCEFSYVHLHH
jgi:hypothetical protein